MTDDRRQRTDDGGQKTVDKRRMREDRRNQWGMTDMPDFDSYREPYSSLVTFEP
jgi:hypothetical protein